MVSEGSGPVRPAVLSHSVVSVHIAALPTHTVWLTVAAVCQTRAFFCFALRLQSIFTLFLIKFQSSRNAAN